MNPTLEKFQKLAGSVMSKEISLEITYTPDPDEWQISLDFPVWYKDSFFITKMHSTLLMALEEAVNFIAKAKTKSKIKEENNE